MPQRFIGRPQAAFRRPQNGQSPALAALQQNARKTIPHDFRSVSGMRLAVELDIPQNAASLIRLAF
jgi:hypothetical protein